MPKQNDKEQHEQTAIVRQPGKDRDHIDEEIDSSRETIGAQHPNRKRDDEDEVVADEDVVDEVDADSEREDETSEPNKR